MEVCVCAEGGEGMLEDQGSTGVMNHAYVPLYESCFLSFRMTGREGGWAGERVDGRTSGRQRSQVLFFYFSFTCVWI